MPDDVLKVATFNANSIRIRLHQVLDWLARESPDVLCLQETKVKDQDFPQELFRAAGYHLVFRGQKAHAGVAVVSRHEPTEVAFGLDDGGPPDEVRLIHLVVRGVPLVNTYVPQGRSPDSPIFEYKLEWFARLRSFFDRHHSPDAPLLWLGDFNVAPEPIDVHDPTRLSDHVDFHPRARQALEQVREWGFVDLFRRQHPDEPDQYTYWDYRVRNAVGRKVGWRVDHIWATEPLARRCLDVWIDVEGRRVERPSDHTFVVATFSL